jgi:aspartate aminotransferase
MKTLSELALNVKASTTMAIDAKAKQMRAEGIDVVGFGAGEPDFKTPDNISMAAINAICSGKTKYTPASGLLELKKAVCNSLKRDLDLNYLPTNINVSDGAKPIVYISLRVLLNPGDEVILPAPYWVSYLEMIKMTGGVPKIISADKNQGFKVSAKQVEAAITEKTKCIILNNPCNPSGAVYSRKELNEIADICVNNDIYIISDEIYYELLYNEENFTSIASLSHEIQEHTILVNGVSKSYAMTGWRIGYCASNETISKVISNYLSHSTGSPCSISQWASVEALNGDQSSVKAMRDEFKKRRDYMANAINNITGVSCEKPDGAFYIMMNLDEVIGKSIDGVVITSSDDFAEKFLEKELVAIVPCTGFGFPNYVRWSYATSMENIQIGMKRLEKFVLSLK